MSKLTEFHENGWDVSVPIGPNQTNPLMFTSNVWRQTGSPELAEFLLKRGATIDVNVRSRLEFMVSYGVEHESFKLNRFTNTIITIIKFGDPSDDINKTLLKNLFKCVDRMYSVSASEKKEFRAALLNADAERDALNKFTYIKPAGHLT